MLEKSETLQYVAAMKNAWLGIGVGLTALCMAHSAAAQQAANTPNVDPGRLDERFEPITPPESQLDAPSIAPQGEIDGESFDDSITLTLEQIVLEGNTAFTQAQLEPLYAEFLGKEVPLPTIQTIATRITTFYRNEGYVLSRAIIPPQQIDDGVVTIRVLEGYVNDVEFEGGNRPTSTVVNAYVQKILESKPLNIAVLERYLLLLDDLAGVHARGTLAPSPDTQGASILLLSLNDKGYEGRLGVDNRGSRFLGPLQGDVSLSANNKLGDYDQLNARIVGTLNWEELKYGALTYTQPIGAQGTKVSASLSHALTEPGAGLRTLDIEGKSTTISLSATHPLIRSRKKNLNLFAAATMRDSESQTLGVQVFEDHVRTLELGMNYDNADRFRGVNQFSFSATQGLFTMGANGRNDLISRSNADPEFTKIEMSAARYQALGGGWSAQLSSKAQYAFDPLFSSEEFDIGGQQFGSAYDASEATGDHGVAGRFEAQYRFSEVPSWTDYLQLYGFYDIGVAWNHSVLVGEQYRSSLSSTGLGARFSMLDDIISSVEVALPLTKQVAAQGTNGRDARAFFTLAYSF